MFENCVSSHQRLSSSLSPNVDSFPLVKSRSKLFSIDCWEVGKTLNSFNTIPLDIIIWLHRRDAIRLQKKSHITRQISGTFVRNICSKCPVSSLLSKPKKQKTQTNIKGEDHLFLIRLVWWLWTNLYQGAKVMSNSCFAQMIKHSRKPPSLLLRASCVYMN